jgi:site-specific recombinase XerD
VSRQKHFVYKSFLTYIGGDRPVREVSTRQITDYLKNRVTNDGEKVANRDLKELKALYNWGINQEITDLKLPLNK